VIYAGVKGYLDKLPVSKSVNSRKLSCCRRALRKPCLLRLRRSRSFTDDSEAKIKAMIEDVIKRFVS